MYSYFDLCVSLKDSFCLSLFIYIFLIGNRSARHLFEIFQNPWRCCKAEKNENALRRRENGGNKREERKLQKAVNDLEDPDGAGQAEQFEEDNQLWLVLFGLLDVFVQININNGENE